MIYYSEIQHELNRKNDDPEWDEQGKPISNARPAWSYRGSRRNTLTAFGHGRAA